MCGIELRRVFTVFLANLLVEHSFPILVFLQQCTDVSDLFRVVQEVNILNENGILLSIERGNFNVSLSCFFFLIFLK